MENKEAKIRGAMFTGGGGKLAFHNRQAEDFYATPKNTTEAILKLLDVSPKSILEPSAGMGHISKVLEKYYPNSEIVSTDIVDRGYCEGGVDFLTYNFKRNFDLIITNPPFKYAKDFVEKALTISNDKVVMLLKIQFLESVSRKEFLEKSPLKYVYVFSKRQNTMKDGLKINPRTGKGWNSAFLLAWFVWEKGYEGEPIIRWI